MFLCVWCVDILIYHKQKVKIIIITQALKVVMYVMPWSQELDLSLAVKQYLLSMKDCNFFRFQHLNLNLFINTAWYHVKISQSINYV